MSMDRCIFYNAKPDEQSEESSVELSPDDSVPRRYKCQTRYKMGCLLLVLTLIFEICFLIDTLLTKRTVTNSDTESCSKSDRAIWIPYKDNGGLVDADKSRYYCSVLDHKLPHLIDLLVIANKSTVPTPKSQHQSWTASTRPSTQIIHYKGLTDPSSFTSQFQLQLHDENEVRILENGGVEIQQDGVYNVYSIVTFVHTNNESMFPKDEHFIYRKRANDQKILLSDTERQIQKLNYFKTLDLSGNFELRQGDILFPEIRNLSSVYRFTAANFWGVYQVRPTEYSIKYGKLDQVDICL